MSETAKSIISIIMILLCIFLLALLIHNLISNSFVFELTIYQFLTMVFALIVSYFLVQQKTDHRRFVESIVTLLRALRKEIQDMKNLKSSEFSRYEDLLLIFQMNTKQIEQKLIILKHVSATLQVKENYRYIKEYYDEYIKHFDEYSISLPKFNEHKKHYDNILGNIDSTLETLVICLYSNKIVAKKLTSKN